MAWSTPLTAVANASLTEAQWNASVRDNLNETAPAKATSSSRPRSFWATGLNSIAQREVRQDTVNATETTGSGTYVDLATVGASVTITTGSNALVFNNCGLANAVVGVRSHCAFRVDTSSIGPDSNFAVFADADVAGKMHRACAVTLQTGLTAGSNTFKQNYAVSGAGTGSFGYRNLVVMAM